MASAAGSVDDCELKYAPYGQPRRHALRYWQRPRRPSGCVRFATRPGMIRRRPSNCFAETAGERRLDDVQRHRRLELSVGELRQSLDRSADAGMTFDVVVPRRDVGVADWPIDGNPFLRVRLEVEVSVPITLAAPRERASADVIAAVPVEPLDFGVRRLALVGPPVGVLFVERVIAPQHGIGVDQLARPAAAMGIVPRRLPCRRVVLAVHDVLAALEQEHAQSALGQLLRGPPARDAGSHHDGVEGLGGSLLHDAAIMLDLDWKLKGESNCPEQAVDGIPDRGKRWSETNTATDSRHRTTFAAHEHADRHLAARGARRDGRSMLPRNCT